MALTAGRRIRAVLAALVLLASLAAVEAAHLLRQHRWNAAILSGVPPTESPGLPAEIRFAQAYAQAADGNDDAALVRFRDLQGDSLLGQAARYNTANILLRQAVKLRAGAQPGQAIPLIELAKETYREVLHHDPSYWDARYNLERAQRLLPEPDDTEEPPAETPSNAERAATTMRGVSVGLP